MADYPKWGKYYRIKKQKGVTVKTRVFPQQALEGLDFRVWRNIPHTAIYASDIIISNAKLGELHIDMTGFEVNQLEMANELAHQLKYHLQKVLRNLCSPDSTNRYESGIQEGFKYAVFVDDGIIIK